MFGGPFHESCQASILIREYSYELTSVALQWIYSNGTSDIESFVDAKTPDIASQWQCLMDLVHLANEYQMASLQFNVESALLKKLDSILLRATDPLHLLQFADSYILKRFRKRMLDFLSFHCSNLQVRAKQKFEIFFEILFRLFCRSKRSWHH